MLGFVFLSDGSCKGHFMTEVNVYCAVIRLNATFSSQAEECILVETVTLKCNFPQAVPAYSRLMSSKGLELLHVSMVI